MLLSRKILATLSVVIIHLGGWNSLSSESVIFTFRAFVLDDPQTDATQEAEYATDDGRQNLSGPHLVAQVSREHTEHGGADDGGQHLWAYLSYHRTTPCMTMATNSPMVAAAITPTIISRIFSWPLLFATSTAR